MSWERDEAMTRRSPEAVESAAASPPATTMATTQSGQPGDLGVRQHHDVGVDVELVGALGVRMEPRGVVDDPSPFLSAKSTSPVASQERNHSGRSS
jgi:hypothetical protein